MSSSPSRSVTPAVVGAFLRRDFSIARSYRLPFILDAFYGVLQLAVYFFISRALPDTSPSELDGAPSYFAFAAIGVVVSLVVESAAQGLADRVRQEQLSGTLEALMGQPLSAFQLCAGFTTFPFVFAVARAAVYLVAAGALMDLDLARTSWVGLLLTFLLSATALSALGILAGAIVMVLKRGEVLASMALFAMTLASGAVFPVSALPVPIATLSELLPLRYAFQGVREALFQGSGWGGDALVLVGFTLVGVPLAVWIFARAAEHAKRAGSLAQY